MKILFLIPAVLMVLGTAWAQSGPTVFVTVPPQKYFVEKISGGRAAVRIMVPPGANPHTYEPKPRQMAELADAAAYFTVGDTFDSIWLPRILGASPDIAVVHTAEGVRKIPMPDGNEHDAEERQNDADSHDHGAGGGHAEGGHEGHGHGALDPHIWLDPSLVRIQAGNIRDGLAAIDPAGAAAFAENTAAFLGELDALDAKIRAILNPIPADRRTFLVFHPSWGYFARAYGLNQAAIEMEGKEPSPRDMMRIIAMAKKTGARVIFVQPQFSEKSAAVIARQIGARVVRLDPLAENWADNLLAAARAFAEALN